MLRTQAGAVPNRSGVQQRRCADHERKQHGTPARAGNIVPGGRGDLRHTCIRVLQGKTGARGHQASEVGSIVWLHAQMAGHCEQDARCLEWCAQRSPKKERTARMTTIRPTR